jgi:hypothetical protein
MQIKPKCHPYWIVDGVRVKNKPVAMEHSSRGYILPCCWLDSPRDELNEELNQFGMLDESLKLENNRSVKSIMITPQWIKFHKTLIENPEMATSTCKDRCGRE